MIKPVKRDCITLTDLKRCKMTAIFFDTFFNLEKYMEHEQRDPFAQKESEEVGSGLAIVLFSIVIDFFHSFFLPLQMSDWDRYAAQEYELLVAEESNDGTG